MRQLGQIVAGVRAQTRENLPCTSTSSAVRLGSQSEDFLRCTSRFEATAFDLRAAGRIASVYA